MKVFLPNQCYRTIHEALAECPLKMCLNFPVKLGGLMHVVDWLVLG